LGGGGPGKNAVHSIAHCDCGHGIADPYSNHPGRREPTDTAIAEPSGGGRLQRDGRLPPGAVDTLRFLRPVVACSTVLCHPRWCYRASPRCGGGFNQPRGGRGRRRTAEYPTAYPCKPVAGGASRRVVAPLG